MPTATLTSKGQLTLPKKVREALGLKPGDQVDFVLDAAGDVRLRPGAYDVRELRGLLRRAGRRAVSLEDMERAIARKGRAR
ncbi:MAG: AbrB/MazE/SpoVT family DNA-binding domain-containing protein [Thermoanaerobaculia bacterium]